MKETEMKNWKLPDLPDLPDLPGKPGLGGAGLSSNMGFSPYNKPDMAITLPYGRDAVIYTGDVAHCMEVISHLANSGEDNRILAGTYLGSEFAKLFHRIDRIKRSYEPRESDFLLDPQSLSEREAEGLQKPFRNVIIPTINSGNEVPSARDYALAARLDLISKTVPDSAAASCIRAAARRLDPVGRIGNLLEEIENSWEL